MSVSDVDEALCRPLIVSASTPFNFRALWAGVEQRCRCILEWETAPEMSSPQKAASLIVSAYTLVYHLVSHPCTDVISTLCSGHAASDCKQVIAVYEQFQEMLRTHLRENVQTHFTTPRGSDVEAHGNIKAYVRLWRSYMVAAVNLKTVFAPIFHIHDSLEMPVLLDSADVAAKSLWQEVLSTDEIMTKLTQDWRSLMRNDRSGAAGDDLQYAVVLKAPLEVLSCKGELRIWLEGVYMEEIHQFYEAKMDALANVDILLYCTECTRYLEEEVKRAENYLWPRNTVKEQLVKFFVDSRMELFSSIDLTVWIDVEEMLPHSQEPIRAIYALLRHSESRGLPFIRNCFMKSVGSVALQTVQKTIMRNPTDGMGCALINFIKMYHRLHLLAQTCFDGDSSMMLALESGLRQGLVGGATGGVSVPALTDRLCALSHAVFAKEGMMSDNVTVCVEDVVAIFQFLPDAEPSAKEMFLKAYHKELASRLLSRRSDADEERHALALLGLGRPSLTLFYCRSMLQEFSVVESCASRVDPGGACVNPIVISQRMWPRTTRNATLRLRASVQDAINHAHLRCAALYPGQNLTFLQLDSTARVHMRLPKGDPFTKVQIHVSIVQLCVVEAFNMQAEWSFVALCEEIGATPTQVRKALLPFISASLLESTAPLGPEATIRVGTCDRVTEASLNLIPRNDSEVAKQSVAPETLQRKQNKGAGPLTFALQGSVVSSLKSSGPLDIEQIHKAVSARLAQFSVSREVVKSVLESLIEREFVERVANTNLFQHVV